MRSLQQSVCPHMFLMNQYPGHNCPFFKIRHLIHKILLDNMNIAVIAQFDMNNNWGFQPWIQIYISFIKKRVWDTYLTVDKEVEHFWEASVSTVSIPICWPVVHRAHLNICHIPPFLRIPVSWYRRTQSHMLHILVGYPRELLGQTTDWWLKANQKDWLSMVKSENKIGLQQRNKTSMIKK